MVNIFEKNIKKVAHRYEWATFINALDKFVQLKTPNKGGTSEEMSWEIICWQQKNVQDMLLPAKIGIGKRD